MTPNNNSPTAPPTFQAKDRTWTINLTLGLIDDIRDATGIDLAPEDGKTQPIAALAYNHRKLADVLWACVESQAAKAGISSDEFRKPLDRDSFVAGWEALLDAVGFFTPSLAPALELEVQTLGDGLAVVAKMAAKEEVRQTIKTRIEEIAAELEQELPKALAESATNLPASSV